MTINPDAMQSIFEEDPDLLMDIGRIVTIWSTIEFMMSFYLHYFAGFDMRDARAIAYNHNSGVARITTIKALLLNHQTKRGVLEAIDLLKPLEKLYSVRNRIVHDVPMKGFDPGAGTSRYTYANLKKGGFSKDNSTLARELVKDHLRQISEHGGKMNELISRLSQ